MGFNFATDPISRFKKPSSTDRDNSFCPAPNISFSFDLANEDACVGVIALLLIHLVREKVRKKCVVVVIVRRPQRKAKQETKLKISEGKNCKAK